MPLNLTFTSKHLSFHYITSNKHYNFKTSQTKTRHAVSESQVPVVDNNLKSGSF